MTTMSIIKPVPPLKDIYSLPRGRPDAFVRNI